LSKKAIRYRVTSVEELRQDVIPDIQQHKLTEASATATTLIKLGCIIILHMIKILSI